MHNICNGHFWKIFIKLIQLAVSDSVNSEIGPRLTDIHLVNVVARVPHVLRWAFQLRPLPFYNLRGKHLWRWCRRLFIVFCFLLDLILQRNAVHFCSVLGTIDWIDWLRVAQNLTTSTRFEDRPHNSLLLRLIFLLTFHDPWITVGTDVLRAIFTVTAATFIEKLSVGASQRRHFVW